MGSRVVWAHLAPNKRLVSPSYCLTFMPHVIFVKNGLRADGPSGWEGSLRSQKKEYSYLVYF